MSIAASWQQYDDFGLDVLTLQEVKLAAAAVVVVAVVYVAVVYDLRCAAVAGDDQVQ